MTRIPDGDSQDSSNIWNRPLKKVEPVIPPKPLYEPTQTPGIVRNTKTGGLETNFPEQLPLP